MSGSEALGIGGFGLAIIGFMWKMSNDMRALTQNSENNIKKLDEDHEKKRGRVYERVDEIKASADCTFVRKDVCKVVHDALREQIKEGFKNIENKIDSLISEKNG